MSTTDTSTAICVHPGEAGYWFQASQQRFKDNNQHDAYRFAVRAATLDPYRRHHCSMAGFFAVESGRFYPAYVWFSKALCLSPGDDNVIINLGVVFEQGAAFDRALSFAQRASVIDPGLNIAQFNMGKAFMAKGEITAAIEHYEKAVEMGLTTPGVLKTLSLAHLVSGSFLRGWKLYESRFDGNALDAESPRFLTSSKPYIKDFKNLRKKSVLVWAEQGVGDEIMFGSMLREFYDHVGKLLVQLDTRLIPLFRRSLPKNVIFFERGLRIPEEKYDCHAALGSLGQHLRPDLESFANKGVKYLWADPRRVSEIQKLLARRSGETIVGISWRSSNHETGQVRSIALADFIQSLKTPHVRLVNLQYGPVESEIQQVKRGLGVDVWRCPQLDPTHDLDGLAALIEACDEVVSVGNATAHLSGALGVATTVLLPKMSARNEQGRLIPGWRWLGETTNCLWYDSVTLNRWQKHELDFSGVLARLTAKRTRVQ